MVLKKRKYFLQNLVLFGRILRDVGLDVGPVHVLYLAKALEHVDISVRSEFYHACRCLLVYRRGDISLFDKAFELFWKPHGRNTGLLESKAKTYPTSKIHHHRLLKQGLPSIESNREAVEHEPKKTGPSVIKKTFSSSESLQNRDFSKMTEDETEAVQRLMISLAYKLGDRLTRRYRISGKKYIAWRRTLQINLRYGGEVLKFAHCKPRRKPRPLILLADISGSMEHYTKILLHFFYGLTQTSHGNVETFTFGTRLTRVSTQMRDRNFDSALANISSTVQDWSGGTRIGESLHKFNRDWGRRVLGRNAVVILVSDGWDCGDPKLLSEEMRQLERSCRRLIWLNPLLGSEDYEPLTRGMMAALPHIDDFLPVHNISSLEELSGHLENLKQ